MRALVVYESIFGNTRAVAEAIAAGIASTGAEAHTVEVASAPRDGRGFDLVVVGGPIHAWGMTRAATRDGARREAEQAHVEPVSKGIGVRDWLDELAPAVEHPAAAAFDTAADLRWFPVGSAAKGEAALLSAAGYRVVAPPEHFRVKDRHGPLVHGELDRARAWGVALVPRAHG